MFIFLIYYNQNLFKNVIFQPEFKSCYNNTYEYENK